jgi:hypothetical protein
MDITIIKKIAKQGVNRVLVIPKHLHPYLNDGEVVKVQISTMPLTESKDSESSAKPAVTEKIGDN